jgi:hypothetical protein
MENGSRTRLVTVMIIAVIFSTGLVVGLAADSSLQATPIDDVVAESTDENAEEARPRRTPMYERVGPTAEQSVVISEVLKANGQRMKALHEEFDSAYQPRYRALIQETRRSILGVFTLEQAVEYQELLDAFDQRRAEREQAQREKKEREKKDDQG